MFLPYRLRALGESGKHGSSGAIGAYEAKGGGIDAGNARCHCPAVVVLADVGHAASGLGNNAYDDTG